MDRLRVGVIGVGGMGGSHCSEAAVIAEIDFRAGADVNEANREQFKAKYNLPCYAGHREFLEKEALDGVCIAAPHVFHCRIALDAFAAGKHVFCEKPMAVTVSECDRMIEAADKAGKKLGVVFQRRMEPLHQEVARRIKAGGHGELIRANMISAWLRTQRYFETGARWRGTWKGEGGGLLLNQAPHQLDLFQWLAGMPAAVTALTANRFHRIETEDQASALFEYANGAQGQITISTIDYTGRMFFQIVGTKAAITLDHDAKLTTPNHPIDAFIRESDAEWGKLETTTVDIATEGENSGHGGQLRDWALAVLHDRAPIVDGREGAKTTELANAIILSSERRKTVELPVDRDEYDELLREKIAGAK